MTEREGHHEHTPDLRWKLAKVLTQIEQRFKTNGALGMCEAEDTLKQILGEMDAPAVETDAPHVEAIGERYTGPKVPTKIAGPAEASPSAARCEGCEKGWPFDEVIRRDIHRKPVNGGHIPFTCTASPSAGAQDEDNLQTIVNILAPNKKGQYPVVTTKKLSRIIDIVTREQRRASSPAAILARIETLAKEFRAKGKLPEEACGDWDECADELEKLRKEFCLRPAERDVVKVSCC